MTKRIDKLSSYIEDDEKVIDVGCDMALLSVVLAKRGIYSIASDLRENIIDNAKLSISPVLKKFIDFRVGNGITLRDDEDGYTLVLAGMGSYLMVDIMRNTKKSFEKIVTISNNNHDMLRREFLTLGYVVDKEEIIKERGKYYNLIVFKKGFKCYSNEELILGLNHQNINLFKERNQVLLDKYENILKVLPNDDKRKELDCLVSILKTSI